MMTVNPYQDGFMLGALRAVDDDYDPRWDFADHARAGTFEEFKRGFDDGFKTTRGES